MIRQHLCTKPIKDYVCVHIGLMLLLLLFWGVQQQNTHTHTHTHTQKKRKKKEEASCVKWFNNTSKTTWRLWWTLFQSRMNASAICVTSLRDYRRTRTEWCFYVSSELRRSVEQRRSLTGLQDCKCSSTSRQCWLVGSRLTCRRTHTRHLFWLKIRSGVPWAQKTMGPLSPRTKCYQRLEPALL